MWGQGLYGELLWGGDYDVVARLKSSSSKIRVESDISKVMTMRLKSSSSKIRVESDISKVMTMRLKSSSSQIRTEQAAHYLCSISLKSSSSKIRVSVETGAAATVRLKSSASKIRVTAGINLTATVRLKSSTTQIRVYADIATLPASLNYDCTVVNTVLGAHTEYTAYNFNSLAYAHGKVYMAGTGGLFYESNVKDEIIPWRIKTGEVDSNQGTETMPAVTKREFDIYHDFVADDDAEVMECIVTGDYDGSYTYSVYSAEYDDRIPIGKGFNSRWYAFEMKNSTVTGFHGSQIRLLTNQTKRRR